MSITLFVLRFFWKWAGSAMMQKRWVKIVPHVVDTLLLLSGISLIFITHFYPFSPQGTWLTEKLFGVIIYIALGFVALSKRPVSQKPRWLAFMLALGLPLSDSQTGADENTACYWDNYEYPC
jgi:uncharacterized membrane protein SirB2